MWIFIILFLISVIVIGFLSKELKTLKQKDNEIIKINIQRKAENEQLDLDYSNKQKDLKVINERIVDAQQNFKTIGNSLQLAKETMLDNAKKLADAEFRQYENELITKQHESIQSAEREYEIVLKDLGDKSQQYLSEMLSTKEKLENLKAIQTAFIEAQKRKEELELKKDYYRLKLSSSDEADIEMLRDIQNKMSRKETIDKVIWEIYYKPAYDILIANLFVQKKKTCGIYKITCLTNDKAYIGQSVDIAERFRQHIKTSLSSAPSTNKLYQEMKKYLPHNFTFEILEEVPRDKLNERETYWIDMYKTKDYGLNKTQGGA